MLYVPYATFHEMYDAIKESLHLFQYKRVNDRKNLHSEQINTSRSVQQLQANVCQLKQLRFQVFLINPERFALMLVYARLYLCF